MLSVRMYMSITIADGTIHVISRHQAAMKVCRAASCIVSRIYSTIVSSLPSSKHARSTLLHAHAARPQVQAIPGAHPGIDMHNESLATGAPKRWRFCSLS